MRYVGIMGSRGHSSLYWTPMAMDAMAKALPSQKKRQEQMKLPLAPEEEDPEPPCSASPAILYLVILAVLFSRGKNTHTKRDRDRLLRDGITQFIEQRPLAWVSHAFSYLFHGSRLKSLYGTVVYLVFRLFKLELNRGVFSFQTLQTRIKQGCAS